MTIVVAGGQENISAVQSRYAEWARETEDRDVIALAPHAYMPMLQTAEFVNRKYGISRESQDEFALMSEQRTAAAQAEGKFSNEIVALTTTKTVVDKNTGKTHYEPVTLTQR